MSRLKLLLLQLLVAVFVFLLWHVLTSIPLRNGEPLFPPFFFSTPLDVFARVVKWFREGTIWRHLWITLSEAMLAFAIGSIAGILVGFWLR